MPQPERKPHDDEQQAYFNERVDLFLQPIPEVIQNRTRTIVQAAALGPHSTVLDVGTGTGVLIQYFLEEGVSENSIVGCDLSSGMLERAQMRYPGVCFWLGDCIDFSLEKVANLPRHIAGFSAIFFNACFGNIFDQLQALEIARNVLYPGGRIVIGHPMGARFVAALHKGEPEIVPHLLPDKEQIENFCEALHLVPGRFVDESELYIAVLQKGAAE